MDTWADQDLGSNRVGDQLVKVGNPAPRIHVNHLGSTEISCIRPSFIRPSAYSSAALETPPLPDDELTNSIAALLPNVAAWQRLFARPLETTR